MAYDTFKKYVEDSRIQVDIIVTSEPTKTAVQAAQVHNVPVSNIVKSLLVKIDGGYKLFLVPGDKRLDLEKLAMRFGTDDIRMANADEVKDVTGYSIGGVPPFGHKHKLETYIEEGFDSTRELIAAGGAGNAVFRITLAYLKEIIT
ncbi:MAG: YbaK/prolyl-tRNA synthetase associated region [candidate division WS6 bacterium GW2011_GWF2_39_15]|uniref:YbaK/prolyl-tRNA synthetase associated region n=1 Tax=candidate division WS6 bacterium GW2011_GWF2_39_15 TaxID=1619100 RepID=A0A0G0QX42_9BACT|nr:MAG: YbaK/prolyl-tRNA synthetase associated region [candidate division WS6 bacterium GW2011_GWF2_39_15]